MTTQSWSANLANSTDADFRAFGSDFSTKLAAIGMVQTSDTGQINWTTVTKPVSNNTIAGYEIWRFNDTLQSTAPIYLKIQYGNGVNAGTVRMDLQVGTGSNGSGTLTGTTTTNVTCARTSNVPPTGTQPRYFSAGEGYCNVVYHASAGLATLGFLICRTCDNTGAPTATGCVVYTCTSNSASTGVGAVQALRFASTATAYTASTVSNAVLVPHGITSSLTGTDIQAFIHWFPTPRIAPAFDVCTHIASEISAGSTFTATLVGTTARTFISVGTFLSAGWNGSASYALAMLWE